MMSTFWRVLVFFGQLLVWINDAPEGARTLRPNQRTVTRCNQTDFEYGAALYNYSVRIRCKDDSYIAWAKFYAYLLSFIFRK